MLSTSFVALLLAIGCVRQVAGHGALLAINGDNGVTSQGFGIDESTVADSQSQQSITRIFGEHLRLSRHQNRCPKIKWRRMRLS